MLRVANKARIFPLLGLSLIRSPHVEPPTKYLKFRNLTVEFRKVDYEIQRGGNDMMSAGRGR